METIVKIKYIKQSATKVRFVSKLVEGMQVSTALNKLDVANKKAAITISKAIRSGISNLVNNNENVIQENLYISNVAVDQGPTMKRFRPAAMGRATPILKRSSHLTLTLTERKK